SNFDNSVCRTRIRDNHPRVEASLIDSSLGFRSDLDLRMIPISRGTKG
ncbi:hypothetical protein TorRG33x02_081610, partial [Trema orientale]